MHFNFLDETLLFHAIKQAASLLPQFDWLMHFFNPSKGILLNFHFADCYGTILQILFYVDLDKSSMVKTVKITNRKNDWTKYTEVTDLSQSRELLPQN